MTASFTLLDCGVRHEVPATLRDGRVRIPAAALEEALGWALRDEGLCRGDACVPVRDRSALLADDGIDLEELARVLDRPLALDAAEGAAAIGVPASDRSAALVTLDAPDFTLPDLQGRLHSLSDHRGKKVLLIAYASW
jgi:hypothetical protein